MRQVVLGAALLLASGASIAAAVDVGVVGKKLIVVDKLSQAGTAKVVYVSKDQAAGITKGAGTNPHQISVHFDMAYESGSTAGAFSLPLGASDGTSGWLVNKEAVAKYVNTTAPEGLTQAKAAVIKPGKLLKLVGKGLGDEPLDVLAAGDPGPDGVKTAYCVTNGGERFCHCSSFTGCNFKPIAGGTGAKLVCKTSTADPTCSAESVPCGSFLLTWGSFGAEPGQFISPYGVAVGGNGHVYVTDSENDRIQAFDGAGAFLLEWGSSGTAPGQFAFPIDVAVDGAGNVYVVELENHRVQKFDDAGAFLLEWGSFGIGLGQLAFPFGLAVDGDGNVYVADSENNRIQKFDGLGNFLSAWGSLGTGPGQFTQPASVAVDGSGNVYVADAQNHRIQKFDSSGTFLLAFGSSGTGPGQFFVPAGVAVDGNDDLYVADFFNDRIQKFDGTGTFLLAWGSTGVGAGLFNQPPAVAVDAGGSIYVADSQNHRIQKFACSP